MENKNYTVIDGKKVQLNNGLIEQIKPLLVKEKNVKLCDIPVGETFFIEAYEFIVLEQNEDKTVSILKDLYKEDVCFGNNNNYKDSNIDKICCSFAEKITALASEECLTEFSLDLTSNDGLKDYGSIQRNMAILTADLYRKYVHILDMYKIDSYWWLSTAWSTSKHDNDSYTLCVSPRGSINGFNFYCGINFGVRPFCIFKSNIFVSK